MLSVRSAISLLALLVLLPACSRKVEEKSPVVVSVYNQELLASDLEGIVPAGFSPEDSIAIVNNYIDQWLPIPLF